MYSFGSTLHEPNGKQKPPRACAGGKSEFELVPLCGSSKVQKSSTFRRFSIATLATKQLLNMSCKTECVCVVRRACSLHRNSLQADQVWRSAFEE